MISFRPITKPKGYTQPPYARSTLNKTHIAVFTALAALVVLLLCVLISGSSSAGRGRLRIVLDPGHGGRDVGAVNKEYGLYESELNMIIADACRDELLKYRGVDVFMTREGDDADTKISLDERVNMVGEQHADILVSLHLNDSKDHTLSGAEVYVPHSTAYKKYNYDCTKLANEILSELEALGLSSNGVLTRNSNGDRMYRHRSGLVEVGDYYAVIGDPIIRFSVPGILVEHCYINCDSEFLDSRSKLEALGRADAEGIARYYGLKRK